MRALKPSDDPIPSRKTRGIPSAGRRAGTLLLLLGLVVSIGGCGKLFSSSGPGKPEPLVLVGFAATPSVRVNDALIIEVVLMSQYKKPLLLSTLNAESVSFWITEEESGRTFKRNAVASPKEDLGRLEELGPGEVWRRRFVLTQAAETSGTFRIQTFYGGGAAMGDDLPGGEVYSVPLGVTVRGDATVHRDTAGVLLRDDAIRIARDWAAMPEAQASATLVENEAGFLDWWVRLAPAGSSSYRKACLVNPYLGDVRAEANPAHEPPAPKQPEIKVLPPKAPTQPLGDTEGRSPR